MAFVIIQHLSPSHKSIMASLLKKQARMVVREIEDGAKLLANHVYLNPPGKNVAIFNRSLHLLEPIKSGTINMPVDFFFRSLSEDQGEKAIGIILSGTAKTRRKTGMGKILDVWISITALKDERDQPVEIASTEWDLAWLSKE